MKNNQWINKLGESLPANNIHAVSVALPYWQDVIGYEECEPRVHEALKTGYPRFVYHPLTQQLCQRYEQQWQLQQQKIAIFPSSLIAKDCVRFVARRSNDSDACFTRPIGQGNLTAVIYQEEYADKVKEYWQHSGLILSSRICEDALHHALQVDDPFCKEQIKQRIATGANIDPADVYLTPSGMASIYYSYQAIDSKEKTHTIQLGFPYLDTLKIQQKWPNETIFVNLSTIPDIQALEDYIKNYSIKAVFCEFPTNPLLEVIDIEALSKLLRTYEIPLIIDDTLSTYYNADLLPHAEMVVTSLTKFFSGIGDVIAGSIMLNAKSPLHESVRSSLQHVYEDVFYVADAHKLEINSRDFSQRMQIINQNALEIVDFLQQSSLIEAVYFPTISGKQRYDNYASHHAGHGYGGLLSFTFHNPSHAVVFYDAVELAKGPSLGTNFTLLCPYTMLAHYFEFDFAREHGVAPELIRLSVGVEDKDWIINRLKDAFNHLT